MTVNVLQAFGGDDFGAIQCQLSTNFDRMSPPEKSLHLLSNKKFNKHFKLAGLANLCFMLFFKYVIIILIFKIIKLLIMICMPCHLLMPGILAQRQQQLTSTISANNISFR